MSTSPPEADPNDPRWNKRGGFHVPAGQGPTVWGAGDVYTIKATGAQTNGALGFIEATVPAGGGPQAHVHLDTDETFYILDGELEFLDGDHIFTAVAGDFIHIPRGTRHRIKNRGNHAARLIFMFTPPGQEQFFAEYCLPVRPGETPPPLDNAQIARFAEGTKGTQTFMLPEPS
ncbi:cupin domain-containing protein [Streptomyces sp. NPDC001970]